MSRDNDRLNRRKVRQHQAKSDQQNTLVTVALFFKGWVAYVKWRQFHLVCHEITAQ